MKILKNILKNESGQALAIALILLALGGLLVVPMLSLMTTSLNANRIIDVKTSATYAADAGIQDALWKLGDGVDLFASGDSYDLAENLNGMAVTVEKQALEGDLYTLRSTARLNGEVKAVIVAQAIAGSDDFSWLFGSAITSPGQVTLANNVIVSGNVTSSIAPNLGNHAVIKDGSYQNNTTLRDSWPTCNQFKDFYLPQVAGASDPGGSISLSSNPNSPTSMGPWHHNGNLSISNNGFGRLNGPIYVTGDFTAENNCTIYLNGETIFAEGAITISNNTVIQGPGAVIACGAVFYACNTGSNGSQLIGGVDETTVNNGNPVTGSVPQNIFILSKLQASAGTMSCFHVYCTGPGHVKLAIYDATGTGEAPKNRLNVYADNATGTEVQYGWNTFDFPKTTLAKKTNYWLAANSDADVIGRITKSSTQKWNSVAFSNVFPNPAGTIPNTDNTIQYLLSGWSGGQEFVMVMSVGDDLTLKNNGIFYGSIAAGGTVDLENNDVATLVNMTAEGLNFPGTGGSGDSGTGTGGNAPPLLNYKIQ